MAPLSQGYLTFFILMQLHRFSAVGVILLLFTSTIKAKANNRALSVCNLSLLSAKNTAVFTWNTASSVTAAGVLVRRKIHVKKSGGYSSFNFDPANFISTVTARFAEKVRRNPANRVAYNQPFTSTTNKNRCEQFVKHLT